MSNSAPQLQDGASEDISAALHHSAHNDAGDRANPDGSSAARVHNWDAVHADGDIDAEEFMLTEHGVVERFRSRGHPTMSQKVARSMYRTFFDTTWRDFLENMFPILKIDLSSYTMNAFQRDVLTGLTISVVMIPQALSYAPLVGVATQYGMYAAFFPPLVYFFMGASKEGSIGPFAISAVMLGQQINNAYPHIKNIVDIDERQAASLDAAMSLTFYAGMCLTILSILRCGWISSLISGPSTSGFIAGSMFAIIFSQLSAIFQIPLSSTANVFENIIKICSNITDTNICALIIGILSILIIWNVEGWAERNKINKPMPTHILLVIVATVISYLARFQTKFNLGVVGTIKQGFEAPTVPYIGSFGNDFGPAITLALIVHVVSVATAQTVAAQNGYSVNPTQEMRAIGLSCLFGSFFQSYIPCVSLARSTIANIIKPVTVLWSVVMAAVVFICIMVAGPLFFHLPRAVLAAIIIASFRGALLRMDYCYRLWFVSPQEAFAYFVPFIVTMCTDNQWGLISGYAVSIFFLLYNTSRPTARVLARLPGTQHFRSVKHFPQAREDPSVTLFRFDSTLHFVNQELFYERITAHVDAKLAAIASTPQPDVSAAVGVGAIELVLATAAASNSPGKSSDPIDSADSAAESVGPEGGMASGAPATARGVSAGVSDAIRAAATLDSLNAARRASATSPSGGFPRRRAPDAPPSPMTHPRSTPEGRLAMVNALTRPLASDASAAGGAAVEGLASPVDPADVTALAAVSASAALAAEAAEAEHAAATPTRAIALPTPGPIVMSGGVGSHSLPSLAASRFFPPAAIAAQRAAVLWRHELPPGLELVVVINAHGISGIDVTALTMLTRLMSRNSNKVVFLFVGCRARLMRFMLGQTPHAMSKAVKAEQKAKAHVRPTLASRKLALSPPSVDPSAGGAGAGADSRESTSATPSTTAPLNKRKRGSKAAAVGKNAVSRSVTVSVDEEDDEAAVGSAAAAAAAAAASGEVEMVTLGGSADAAAAATAEEDEDDEEEEDEEGGDAVAAAAAEEARAAAAAKPFVPAPAAKAQVPATSVIPAITSLSFHNLMNAVVFGKSLTTLAALRRCHNAQREKWLEWQEKHTAAAAALEEATNANVDAMLSSSPSADAAGIAGLGKDGRRSPLSSSSSSLSAPRAIAAAAAVGEPSPSEGSDIEGEAEGAAAPLGPAMSAHSHANSPHAIKLGSGESPEASIDASASTTAADAGKGKSTLLVRASSSRSLSPATPGASPAAAADGATAGAAGAGSVLSVAAASEALDVLAAAEPVISLAGVRAPTAAMDEWDDATTLRFLQLALVLCEAQEAERLRVAAAERRKARAEARARGDKGADTDSDSEWESDGEQ